MTDYSFEQGDYKHSSEYLNTIQNQYLINKKELVLLHPNLRIAYGNLERDISRTTYLIQTVQDILSTHYSQDTKSDNLDNATFYAKEALVSIDLLMARLESFVKSCYHSLKLPNHVKLFNNPAEKE